MLKVSYPCVLGAILLAGMTTATVQAQDATAPAAVQFEAPAPYTPSWSDKEIAAIATQLTGTWSLKAASEDGADVSMSITPAPVDGMGDTLYVESVFADTPWEPYRQSMFQLYRYKGEIRLRTYELAIGDRAQGVFNGMGAATEIFPPMAADDLIATLDLELQTTETGFSGSTPYPYPTGVGGAVEMTSSITLDGDALHVADRGFDADGTVVWGAKKDGVAKFVRADAYAKASRTPDGMVLIDYISDAVEVGPEPTMGDELHVHYDGYLSNGVVFDSSYARDMPFVFTFPPGARAITGWGLGMEGFARGTHRKICIPGYLAYGERGNPRANIGPNEPLFFNAFMAHMQGGEAPSAQPVPSQVDPHAGHNHD